ncbi:MAG TPA: hypothetical protein VG248_17375 [Caulobacteraceae bacterium]|jgi:hypothetical protein|nr:hypothetical protein [Caulobacteraceae bacterium]
MTPAIDALAGDLAGKLTRGAGRRTEPPERRTGSRVRRNSWAPGRGAQRVSLTWGQKARRLWAFRRWQRKQERQDGRRIRGCGYIAEAVYELLLNQAVRRKGALDDLSYARIAAIVGHSRSAVIAAIARLKACGWLDWVRRFRDTDDTGRRGPRVEQDYNAYWVCVPEAALKNAGVPPPDTPAPDDDQARCKAEERARNVTDPESRLGRGLDSIGAALAKRETADRSDSESMKIK